MIADLDKAQGGKARSVINPGVDPQAIRSLRNSDGKQYCHYFIEKGFCRHE
jgi:hypothetical protein